MPLNQNIDPDYAIFLRRLGIVADVTEYDDFNGAVLSEGLEEEEEEEDEEEEEEEEEEDEEEEEEEEEDDEDEEVRVLNGATTSSQEQANNNVASVEGEDEDEEVRVLDGDDGGGGGAIISSQEPSNNNNNVAAIGDSEGRTNCGETTSQDVADKEEEGEWNRGEIDGLFCSICMEAWTNDGDHQICCLPCGHIYGLSCIKKWLQQQKSAGKCPQCNKKCTLKGIRLLYASRLHAVDEELQKKIRLLEAKCFSLEKECTHWCKKEVEWRRREADLHKQVANLKERATCVEGPPSKMQSRSSRHMLGLDSKVDRHENPNDFVLQKEFQIDGARLFDVDINSGILVVARRLSGTGGNHMITKISLLPPYERENIILPESMKAIKDLHVSPHEKLMLLASLGKKLTVLSTQSNQTVLMYDLPIAPWSCSWDPNNSHYIYAGLQNGAVLQFDRRQTMRPVESITGLTSNPVHTVCSLSTDTTLGAGVRSVLSASSVGLCHWNFGSSDERPCLVPESENQGICISLACGSRNDDIVASFRPKMEIISDMVASQSMLTPPVPIVEQAVHGSHVLYRRMGSRYQKLGTSCAKVSSIRLPKSAVIERGNQNPFFASGDEATMELVLQELPSLNAAQHIKSSKGPIRDVRYAHLQNSGLLGCLSEDILQLCSTKFRR